MELAVHCSKTICFVCLMTLENFNWNDECILEEVIENKSIEDIDTPIITAAGEQRILLREVDVPDRLVMVLKILIGLRPHIHVEPDDLFVVCTKDEVVSFWMDRDTANPFCS